MKTRVIVSAVIKKNGTLLFGRKKIDVGPYPNTWHLIGGGVKKGESLKDALRREVKEESGIKIRITATISFDDDYEPNKYGEMTHYIFLIFEAEYLSGELKAADDIVCLKWISKENLSKINLNKPSIRLFNKLGYLN